MGETTLQNYVLTGLFALVLLMSTFYVITEFGDSADVDFDTDEYALTKFEEYETDLAKIKNDSDSIYSDTLEAQPDTDAFDILGSWVVQGWSKAKDFISGTKRLTKTFQDLTKDVADYFKLPSFVLTAAIAALIILMVIILFGIMIEKQGIRK